MSVSSHVDGRDHGCVAGTGGDQCCRGCADHSGDGGGGGVIFDIVVGSGGGGCVEESVIVFVGSGDGDVGDGGGGVMVAEWRMNWYC